LAVVAATSLVAAAGVAHAQCDPVDFEEFDPDTVATSIIPGVTITAPPGSCGGFGSVLPIVVDPIGNTSSGNRAVSLQAGCPDFSPDYLRLVFDEPQTFVEFTCGETVGTPGHDFEVRWYNSAGARIHTDTFESGSGIGRLVRYAAADIRRVEIHETGDYFEAIDDLVFDVDTTPPTVEIDTPVHNTCVCGDALVPIVGTVGDDDGDYQCDVLAYRRINADPGDPWVEMSTACGDFSGTLHQFDPRDLPDGGYYVRITGTNACDLTQSDVTVVRVDRSPPAPALTGFMGGGRDADTVCGTVEVLGVTDIPCRVCSVSSWVLEARPESGGSIVLASGTGRVLCSFGTWDTTKVEDGVYRLDVIVTDTCDRVGTDSIYVTVDNAEGCACTPDINGDGVVDTRDLILLLAAWS
jgi:hypothetical protein